MTNRPFTDKSNQRIARTVLNDEQRPKTLGDLPNPESAPIAFQFRRFELATPFTIVGDAQYATADAYEVLEEGFVDTEEGPTFVVTDVLGIHFGLPNGAFASPHNRGSQGTCYHPHDIDRWEVVEFAGPAIWFELIDDLPSSGSVTAGQSARAHFVKPDGTVDTSAIFTVFDELGVHRGRATDKLPDPDDQGSRGRAKWDDVKERLYITEMQPNALRITGTAGAAVYYDDTQFTLSGTPVIMNPPGALSMDGDFTGANLAKNPLGLIFASGDPVHLEWNEDVPQWEAVDKGTQQARFLRFTASADFLTGGSISIDARTYHDGEAPEVDITSILNPDNLTGYDNATGTAIIDTNESPPTYTVVSVSPVAEEFLTDFNVDTSTFKFQKKVRDISVMPRGDESAAWVDIHTGDDCDA